jgi:hypothetical protein
MKCNCHGQRWTTWFLWKLGIKPLNIHHQLSASFGETASACSIVLSWVWRFNSGKETAHMAVREWYSVTPKEWFYEAVQKFSRRWQ